MNPASNKAETRIKSIEQCRGAGGAVIKLPPGSEAGSGSLIFYQRLEEIF